MKKLLIIICILFPLVCHAAKVTDFTDESSPASADLLWLTVDVSTTAADRKITLGNLLLWMATQDISFTGTIIFKKTDGTPIMAIPSTPPTSGTNRIMITDDAGATTWFNTTSDCFMMGNTITGNPICNTGVDMWKKLDDTLIYGTPSDGQLWCAYWDSTNSIWKLTTCGAPITDNSTNGNMLKKSSDVINNATSGTDYAPATSGSAMLKGNGSGGFSSATAGTDYVSPSSSETLTNKTLDAEGTGNSITIPVKIWLPAAGCNNTTATSFWDLPTSNPAVAACNTGTNTQRGTLDFADGSNVLSAQTHLMLPSDWSSSGNLDVKLRWFSSTASTNNISWKIYTSCVADAETGDPSWNTATEIIDAGKGTTLQHNDASGTNVDKTGCAAGELMNLKIARDPTDGDDTFAGTVRLIGVEITYRRAM